MPSFAPLPTLHDRRVGEWVAVAGDETLRLDYDLGPGSVVVDLGAYRGDFAQSILQRYGCRLFLSEPVPSFVDALVTRFAHASEVTVLPFAVGGSDGQLELAVDNDATSSFKAGTSAITVPVRSADVVFRELGLARIDLLKINVEGAEYDILHSLVDGGLINGIQNIQVQFHDFVPDAARRLAELRARLAATHFPTYMHTFVWENWRRREGHPHERTLHEAVSSLASQRERVLQQALDLEQGRRDLAVLAHRVDRMTPSWWWARGKRYVRRKVGAEARP